MLVQLRIDSLGVPIHARFVLHPFEIRDRHAAGVAEDRRQNLDPPLHQHRIALGRGRRVGAFSHHLGIDQRRFLGRDHLFQRAGDEHIHRHGIKLPFIDGIGAAETRHPALHVHMRAQGRGIDAAGAVNRAGVIEHGDEFGALLRQQAAGPSPWPPADKC